MRFIFLLLLIVTTRTQAQTIQAPKVPWLLGALPTGDEIELGRKLFFDPRLSIDNSVSCSSCHVPALGWSDGQNISSGIRGLTGTRNAPTVVNACYSIRQFVDGRTTGQATQALLPLVNPVEMGNRSEQQVMDRINAIPGYAIEFLRIFGTDPSTGKAVTAPRYARVMAAFQSTVTCVDTPAARYMAGNKEALSPAAQIGYGLFVSAKCMQCHPAPLFTDYLLHNNGMEFAGKRQITDNGKAKDLADKNIQARNADIRAFKTQPLLNLRLSAPYNHAGTFKTIRRCVEHYNRGGANASNQVDRFMDQRIRQLGLTETQIDYLTIFIEEGLLAIDYPMYSQPSLP